MSTPVIVFDHVNHVVAVTGGADPKATQKLTEVLDKQRQLVSVGGGQPPEEQH